MDRIACSGSRRGPALTAQPTPAAPGVTIVVPAYREATGIAGVIDALMETVSELRHTTPVEVIVVDDGSPDGTGAAVKPFESESLRLIRHPANRGYGAALKTGIAAARHDWIVITDADGTYPNHRIPDLLADRDGYDMVVGARTGAVREVPLLRRPPKWVLRKLASYLSGQRIPDLNSGLRVMRRSVVERFLDILPDGFSFTTTITLAMLCNGHPVKYHSIDYHKRDGRSKIRPVADTLGFLTLILRTVMLFNPLRIFLPAALFFVGAAFAVAVGSWALTGRIMDVTTILLFVTGVQLLGLGMIADFLDRRLR